jgi:hypothetical protein
MNGTGYSYVVTERGTECERRTSTEIDDVLYWLVSDLTWGMASDYELLHRKDASDFRRILFQEHLELLATVNRNWSRRKQLEDEALLRNHPYSDDQGEQSPLPKPSSTEGFSPPDQ